MVKLANYRMTDIVPNPSLQTRNKLKPDHVVYLKHVMEAGVNLPPILLRKASGGFSGYEIIDGFHRFQASLELGREIIAAELFKGTSHEAIAEGIKHNMTHGLQLIKSDMKRAAKMLYKPGLKGGDKSKEQEPGSIKWVGKQLGISPTTIGPWVRPARAESRRKCNAMRDRKVKAYNAAGEEALGEKIISAFGADVLGKSYEPQVTWSMKGDAHGSPGTPVLMLSDLHYGEKVDTVAVFGQNKYDVETAKRRLKHTVETAVTLLKQHLAHPLYEGIVVVLNGDLISGSLKEDVARTDEGTPLEQAFEVAKLISNAIAFLASEFKHVTVYGVPGNHGRNTMRPWPKFYAQQNLDWLAFRMIADHVERLKNVTTNFPPVRDLTITVAGRRYRITHGDQFKGGDSIIGPIGPVLRGDSRKRVAAGMMPGQPEGYDTLLVGHFHTLFMRPTLIMNGSVVGYNEFALHINAPWEPPQQMLWTTHPRHGITWFMPVLCDEAYSAHALTEKA